MGEILLFEDQRFANPLPLAWGALPLVDGL